MDLGPNEAQQIIKTNARQFLEDTCPTEHVVEMEEDATGFDPAIWKQVCDFGWAGMLVPEQYGGFGGDLTDMAVLAEEIGRALLPSPLFASSVVGALMVMAAGNDAQKQALLPGIASGESIVTLALTEPSGSYEPWGVQAQATQDGAGWKLSGTKLYVSYADAASTLIVAARTQTGDGPDGVTLFVVDAKAAGVTSTILDTIFQDHQFEVALDGVSVNADQVLGPVGGAWPAIQQVLDQAAVVVAAESIGGAERSLELAVDYSQERVQFGRPIGSFQALQHKMARMVTEVTGAQLLVYEAAWRLAGGLDASLEVPMAKAAASGAYTTCSIEGTHIFGGAGYIREAAIQLHFRRAKGAEVLMGDPRWHRKRITRLLAQQPAPAGH
ncbi:MAG: acyl-CoA/acyl-ACP dehydrogenase [Chloroflexi bacterium]|nr:acyl-CoA/acyl-ACP dehydrogenase [Chloroflexota bacterium]